MTRDPRVFTAYDPRRRLPGDLPFEPSLAGGEIGVFRSGTVHDPLDVVYFGPHAGGRAYGRAPDGAERFTEPDPTPGVPAAPVP